MLGNLLHILGVDLQAQLAQVTTRANALKDTALREVREEITRASVTVSLIIAAVLAFFATCVVALIALYTWLEPQYGALHALAAVGGVTLLAAIVMGAVAVARTKSPPVPPPQPVLVVPKPASRPPLNLSGMVAPPPKDASLADVLVHRVSSRAAGATDEALDAAEDAIANGSRTALIGTLAATILIGFVVGRRGGI